MKLLPFIVLVIGFSMQELFCMKRTHDEIQEKDSSESESTSQEQSTQQKRSTKRASNQEESSEKAPRKKQKSVRSLVKDKSGTPLIQAIKSKNKLQAQELIRNRADLTARDKFGNTALVYAAETGDLDLVAMVIGKNPSSKALSRALSVACACGHTEIAQFLIDQKANLHVSELGHYLAAIYSISDGDLQRLKHLFVTSLGLASYFGHPVLVELLLSHGALSNAKFLGNRVPLTAALEKGHNDIIQLLLDKGADTAPKDRQIVSPLVIAAQYNRQEWVTFFLSKQGNNASNIIAKAFSEALMRGYDFLIQLFLPYMTEDVLYPRARDDESPMQLSAFLGKHALVFELIDRTQNKSKSMAYALALKGAVNGNHVALAQKILELSTPVMDFCHSLSNCSSSSLSQVLNTAVSKKSYGMVKVLLHAGASFSEKNTQLDPEMDHFIESIQSHIREQQAKLFEAIVHGNTALVRTVLDLKIDAMLYNSEQHALILASQHGRTEIVKLLLDAKRHHPLFLNLALLAAAYQGYTDIVKLLVAQGATIDTHSYHSNMLYQSFNYFQPHYEIIYGKSGIPGGRTPLMHAASNGHKEIVEFLLAQGASFRHKDITGKSVLACALEHGRLSCAPLIEEKLKKHQESSLNFLRACTQGDEATIKHYLSEPEPMGIVNYHPLTFMFGGKIPEEEKFGQSALEVAVDNGHTSIVALLLQDKQHIKDIKKGLKLAAQKGDLKMVQAILESALLYKDITDRDSHLIPAVEAAGAQANERIVNVLIKAAPKKLSEKAEIRRYALWAAIRAGQASFVKKFIINQKGKWEKLYRSQNRTENPLFIAATAGSLELVQYFLDKGCPLIINEAYLPTSSPSSATSQESVLMAAALGGHVDIIRYLLEKGIDLEITNKTGDTALSLAARAGHKDAVQLLLEKGAKITYQALECTASANHEEIIYMLIERSENRQVTLNSAYFYVILQGINPTLARKLLGLGASLETCTAQKHTALMLAVERGHWNMVECLLEAGANPTMKDAQGRDTLMLAQQKGVKERFEQLIETLTQKRINRQKAFFQAVAQGNICLTQELIAQGADVTLSDEHGKTALMYAVQGKNKDLVELLLQARSPIRAQTQDDITTLHLAVQNAQQEIATLLLNAGISPNHMTLKVAIQTGNWPLVDFLISKIPADPQLVRFLALHSSAEYGKTELLARILAQGIPVNARHFGKTALMMAAQNGHIQCVNLLLKANAQIGVQDNEKLTALDYAKKGGNEVIIRMLEDVLSHKYQINNALVEASAQGDNDLIEDILAQGAALNTQDILGHTPLIHAITHGHAATVELLLARGASTFMITKDGITPLLLAARKGSINLVRLLLNSPSTIDLRALDTALEAAVGLNNRELVMLLIDAAPDKASALTSALHKAISNQKKELAQWLIEQGANVNAEVPPLKITSLIVAAHNNVTDMIKLLLLHGAHISDAALNSAVGAGAFESLALLVGSIDNFHELICSSAQLRAYHLFAPLDKHFLESKKAGSQGFISSLEKQRYEECLLLIKTLETPEVQAYLKDKAICCTNYITHYLETGLCTRSSLLQTPLIWAAMFGNTALMHELLTSSLPSWVINAQDSYGRTALHYAILYGHTECIHELLKYCGTGINLCDNEGNTPLFYAVTKGNLDLINTLLAANAKLAPDKRRVALALKIAAERGWNKIVIRLLFKLKDQPAIFK